LRTERRSILLESRIIARPIWKYVGVRPILLENRRRPILHEDRRKALLLENRRIAHYISEQKKGQFYVPAEGKLILLERKSKAHPYCT
jgi:hypothetical protein